MSFWSGLLKGAANIVPALFTGGASLPATLGATGASGLMGGLMGGGGGGGDSAGSNKGSLIGGLLNTGLGVAGNLAAGKTAGRNATNANAMNADQLRLSAQGQEENSAQNRAKLEMEQKDAQRNALNDAYKNALRSSLAMNMQDSTVGGLPKGVPNIQFGGGARPSAIGAEGKAAASALNNSAMQSLLSPDKLTTLAPQTHFTPTPMQQAGGLENTLGVLGAVGNGLSQAGAQQSANANQTLVQRLLAQLQQDQKTGRPAAGANDGVTGFPTA